MIVENLSFNKIVRNMKYLYFYRLLKEKVSVPYQNEVVKVQSYGIEVERQDVMDGKLVNVQRECIKSISPERYKVHNLLKLLYDNQVSPIHLVDVIGDYVDEYILDFDKQVSYIAY
ncbi:DUF6514 family protein [Clostridium luticellarii]|jgi:hypothetical protein|uniref:DUF6514 family protein n=1 Tax=Clostridium luticellarii TaxID=1691940 RepID=UPI0023542C83|nr:DUF6514 family protein [Clostridium luticellarii]MCI1944536.1 DUF6514 family protein [Clostridium luticellarii]MCI1968035.1 DUF6514 family protein [Clostridium luticellarii]MCI1995573.1 DUF6514 family protein [Clostridium luticellarii]MCI2039907.1 DUF6514 family protein [Clostridium luticellarii]